MNNVRCAGRSTVGEPTPGNRTITKTPCGWTGHRSRWSDWFTGAPHINLTKPCPRCGGRVQLISEVGR